MLLRLGTRGSALAMAQTRRVIDRVQAQEPQLVTEPVVIRTEGDVDKTTPLTVLGRRGVFTSALQAALLNGGIDVAVHSAKDLPSEQPAGLTLAAFPEREDPRDVVVSRHGLPLAALPPAPVIGTSSRRRAVQITRLRPDARIVDLRGNIDTRLQKAWGDELDAIVLAAAGVRRMGWGERITEYLPVDQFVPSPGQGALAVESRANDDPVGNLLARIDDPAVSHAVRAERTFLRAVGGGCTTPVGAYVAEEAGGWRLWGMIAADDGSAVAYAAEFLDAGDLAAHATAIAHELLARVGLSRERPMLVTGCAGIINGSGNVAPEVDPAHDPGVETPTAMLPLAGLRVLVTRPREQAAALADALRARGAEPVMAPTIRIEDVGPSTTLDRALAGLVVGDYDWVVFTSVNAVERLHHQLQERGQSWPVGRAARVAAVGDVTAATLARVGITVDLVPDQSDAAAVVRLMSRQHISGQRVLYPKGDQARDVVPAGLRRAGALVDAVDVYRTVPELELAPEVRDRIGRGEIDVVTFASPSSARGLLSLVGGAEALARCEIICVGPVTAAAVEERGLPVHGIADDASVEGIVDAILARRAASADTAPAGAIRVSAKRTSTAGTDASGAGSPSGDVPAVPGAAIP